ncbi:MAG TPA: hypothetical protein PLN69_11540 [bacterium]|nr:hypothetical protein [bacterium]
MRMKTLGFILLFVVSGYAAFSSDGAGLPGTGELLPEFMLKTPADNDESSYLGVSESDNYFDPSEIDAELVLIEVLSIYCMSCQQQAPVMNKVFRAINGDASLRKKVKIIGIGTGNSDNELGMFKTEKVVQFPLIQDVDFRLHELLGEPRTPFMIFAKPDGHGDMVVVDAHLGLIKKPDELLEMIGNSLNKDANKIAAKTGRRRYAAQLQELEVPLSEDELSKKISEALMAENYTEIKLSTGETIYYSDRGGSRIYARLVSRRIPCSDCHDAFFIYSFDSDGKYLNFVPIYLTRLGNREWDKSDVKKIDDRFRGKPVSDPVFFNPGVDAVTSATITSKLIYDTYEDTAKILELLKSEGFDK